MISLEWEARSDRVDALWDKGVSGWDAASSTFSGIWWVCKYLLVTFNTTALWLLEGIEKLRETMMGGVGSGDAELDTPGGNLLAVWCSGFLNPKGAEWPTREDFVALLVWLPGGLGSSCSSLILGEETGGGEEPGDAFGEDGWGVGKRGKPPDTGFTDNGLVNGPEKACLFILSIDGRGNWADVVSLLLSLRTEWDLAIAGSDDFPSTKSFTFFFSSKGDECHKSCEDPLALKRGAELVFVSLISTGVGST